jgi:adenylate cyclase
MTEVRAQRRLAAILAADVAGYSSLMGVDEDGTLASLKAHRQELFDPKVAEFRGRIVKTTGDGILVEFASAVDAVRCAVEIQHALAQRNSPVPDNRRIKFRIGINVGDIIIDDGDIYGDGVNVAARIEALAEPGAICISDNAYQQVKGKFPLDVIDIGEQRLKNIIQPVRVYGVGYDRLPARPALALPDKPSIAVLPFNNMSGEPEQDYFADGMVEDIITALSQFRQLFVIARNSSFTYKGRAVDIKLVGRELGVRYVLEGSVRKSANRVRITGQLIDALTGAHIWADRSDSDLEDVFELQDRITSSVVGAIAPKLEQAEIERAKRKPTESLDAYDYYLRGMASFYQASKEGLSEALRLYQKAIEIDPHFASAHGMAAWCNAQRKANGWMADEQRELAEAERLARRAVELGKDDAVALSGGGFALFYACRDRDGMSFVERALVLNPNLASAWYISGRLKVLVGEPKVAIEHLARAMRLSPLDPLMSGLQHTTALAYFTLEQYEDALLWAGRSLQERPNFLPTLRIVAASNAFIGRADDARRTVARLLEVEPTMCISNLKSFAPGSRPEDLARYEEGLRRAGLPE